MRRIRSVLLLMVAPIAWGCNDNSAVGNDREAELDPPARPAEVASAGAALQGIATSLVVPQIMTDADLGNVPGMADACVFRMTAVGEPVAVYGPRAILKLNGRLVPLAASGPGRYAADGVTVAVRPLAEAAPTEGLFEAELVLRLPGAPDELGYHGYAECG